jgi:VanZ family protein
VYNFLQKNKTLFVYFPLFIYWLILFAATTLPGKDVPNLGVSDKLEHSVAYMVLSILLCFTYTFQNKVKLLFSRPFLMTILTITLYGALDELHQKFIPGRSCDIKDLMADVTGATVGLIVVFLIKLLNKKETNTAI